MTDTSETETHDSEKMLGDLHNSRGIQNEEDLIYHRICEKPGDSDEECMRIAHEYIEYAAGRFVHTREKELETKFISDRIWSTIIKIFSENIYNVEYFSSIFSICNYEMVHEHPQRIKNFIDLFKAEKIEELKTWFPRRKCARAYKILQGISDEEFEKNNRIEMLDHVTVCEFLAMHNFLNCLEIAPLKEKFSYYHWGNILRDGLDILLKNIIENHNSQNNDIAKNTFRLVLFIDAYKNASICKWHETYENIKKLFSANGIWEVYEKHLPLPKIYNTIRCLSEIGFPETATILIKEHLYRLYTAKKKLIKNF